MSAFINNVDSFSQEYGLTKFQKAKILLHYPIFKANWHMNYGKGFKKDLAKVFYNLFKNYEISIRTNKNNISIPISFENYNLASFREIFWGKEYGEIIKDKNIKTVFDVGANTGMASLYFMLNLELENLVVIEANPILFKQLSFLNNKNVSLENLAIFSKDNEKLNFKITENHRDSHIVDDANDSNVISVDTTKMSTLCSKHNLSEVDLLKMDIEGAEYTILENDIESFKLFKNICIEIHGDDARRKYFRDKLCTVGFDLIRTTYDEGYDCEISFFRKSNV